MRSPPTEVGFTNPAHGFHGGPSGPADDESVLSAGLVREVRMKRQEEPRRGDPLRPMDWHKLLPVEAAASSDRLGWVGLEAIRCRMAPPFELSPPALTHHRLVLFIQPPEEMELRYEGVKRCVPPPAGAISLLPAGAPARWRSSGR